MFGIDLGLRTGSVMLVVKGKAVDWRVIKDKGDLQGHERAIELAKRYAYWVGKLSSDHPGVSDNVAIEEPLFSWGRKNPKAFATSVGLYVRVHDALTHAGYKIREINAKTVKLTAGSGTFDKTQMVQAYVDRNGCAPGSTNKKGQETLADSFFIALAGLKSR